MTIQDVAAERGISPQAVRERAKNGSYWFITVSGKEQGHSRLYYVVEPELYERWKRGDRGGYGKKGNNEML